MMIFLWYFLVLMVLSVVIVAWYVPCDERITTVNRQYGRNSVQFIISSGARWDVIHGIIMAYRYSYDFGSDRGPEVAAHSSSSSNSFESAVSREIVCSLRRSTQGVSIFIRWSISFISMASYVQFCQISTGLYASVGECVSLPQAFFGFLLACLRLKQQVAANLLYSLLHVTQFIPSQHLA